MGVTQGPCAVSPCGVMPKGKERSVNKAMHIGTVLTVICVAALIGAIIWAAQDEGVRETLDQSREIRDSIPTPSQEEAELFRLESYYGETYQIFMMDGELDEGECNTLRELAEPLAERIANPSAAVQDHAERLEQMIERLKSACQ